MKHGRLLLLCACLLAGSAAPAQDSDLLLNHDFYHAVDRIDIRGYAGQTLHTDLKPYGRQASAALFKALPAEALPPQEKAWYERMRLLADDSLAAARQGKGLLRYAYPNGRDLLMLSTPRFQVFVNPVLHSALGLEHHSDSAFRSPLPLSVNTRGAVIRGSAFGKLGFYTEVSENITRFPTFVYQGFRRSEVLYGETFVKRFRDENALDYLGSRAYLTYSPFPELRIKFGKDRVFWGNGYQSLLLSDHAADPLLLSITTRVWKLEYANHFVQMVDFVPFKNDTEGDYPRKYGAFHQLSFKGQRFSVSLFEGVIYQSWLASGYRGFELQYLNPLIFYRAVEQAIGSADNAVLGLQGKWNLFRRLQLYGQLLVDDFNYARFREAPGYWGTKTGFQAGLKCIDLGLPFLDLQAEYNRVRPYVYQHFNSASNYAQFGQPLGHAAGGNLHDAHLILRYHPLASWQFWASYSYLAQGLDPEGGLNYGGDIGRPHVQRPADFGVRTLQGALRQVHHAYARVSRQIGLSDAWLEAEGRWRSENGQSSASFMVGLRVNAVGRLIRF